MLCWEFSRQTASRLWLVGPGGDLVPRGGRSWMGESKGVWWVVVEVLSASQGKGRWTGDPRRPPGRLLKSGPAGPTRWARPDGGARACRAGCVTRAHVRLPETAPIRPGATRPAAGAVDAQGVRPRWTRARRPHGTPAAIAQREVRAPSQAPVGAASRQAHRPGPVPWRGRRRTPRASSRTGRQPTAPHEAPAGVKHTLVAARRRTRPSCTAAPTTRAQNLFGRGVDGASSGRPAWPGTFHA